jgi:hypothetical protein
MSATSQRGSPRDGMQLPRPLCRAKLDLDRQNWFRPEFAKTVPSAQARLVQGQTVLLLHAAMVGRCPRADSFRQIKTRAVCPPRIEAETTRGSLPVPNAPPVTWDRRRARGLSAYPAHCAGAAPGSDGRQRRRTTPAPPP